VEGNLSKAWTIYALRPTRGVSDVLTARRQRIPTQSWQSPAYSHTWQSDQALWWGVSIIASFPLISAIKGNDSVGFKLQSYIHCGEHCIEWAIWLIRTGLSSSFRKKAIELRWSWGCFTFGRWHALSRCKSKCRKGTNSFLLQPNS